MWAVTETVPDLIWAPDFFGPQEIWTPRNLGPKNVGPCMKLPYDDFHAGTKFLEAQMSRGPNFLGTKKLRAQMRSGTISVIALLWYNHHSYKLQIVMAFLL